jgi:hypothetical protein
MIISLFRVLFLVPKILWDIAGMKRAVRRSKRKFRKALIKNGIPKELAEELANEYAVLDSLITLKGISKFANFKGNYFSLRTEHNKPKHLKAR